MPLIIGHTKEIELDMGFYYWSHQKLPYFFFYPVLYLHVY
jgi:hypothetical protein